jgi:hypothetical protein
MPNHNRITGELEHKVRALCEKGYNATYISKQLKGEVSRETIKKWALKHNYTLNKKISSKTIDIRPYVVDCLKQGMNRKQVQKKFKISFDIVRNICLEEGILIRNRSAAALDKILSNEEASSKLPEGNGKVIGYSKESKKYIVKTDDGFIYYKSSGKLFQGDPRNKSGKKITLEDVKAQLDKIGYDYCDSWTIKREPLRAICRNCKNIRQNKLANFFWQQCPTCSNNGSSKTELEILSWLKGFYPNVSKFYFPENKTRPKEIDIYIPELKLGIEYCGLYWHSEELEQDKAPENKHYQKMLAANKLGIRLITIFENEWKEKESQIKGFLLSAIGKNSEKVYARDCTVSEIRIKESEEFFDKYHIQGAPSNSYVVFGIFYKGELVGAMDGGGHPRKPTKDRDTLYLNRLCFKSDLTVTGGSSRLFSALKKYARKNGYKRVISWSDNRWSEGAVYTKLGFRFDSQKLKGRGLMDGSIWPDFHYVLNGRLYPRSLPANLGVINKEDLPKIYDCGKKRWVFDL